MASGLLAVQIKFCAKFNRGLDLQRMKITDFNLLL